MNSTLSLVFNLKISATYFAPSSDILFWLYTPQIKHLPDIKEWDRIIVDYCLAQMSDYLITHKVPFKTQLLKTEEIINESYFLSL